jgi:hypothetical protein
MGDDQVTVPALGNECRQGHLFLGLVGFHSHIKEIFSVSMTKDLH